MVAQLDFKDFVCKHCSVALENDQVKDWVIEFDGKRVTAATCPNCFEIYGAPKGSIQLEALNGPSFEHDAPLAGAFKPVKSVSDIKRFRDCGQIGEAWLELEYEVFDILAQGYPLAKFGLNVHGIPELWIKLEWNGSMVTAISVSGDLPRRGYFLTVYQKARLRKMGLKEDGTTNKVWTFQPSKAEVTKENLPRIISHILQFGFLIETYKISGISPTVDTEAEKIAI